MRMRIDIMEQLNECIFSFSKQKSPSGEPPGVYALFSTFLTWRQAAANDHGPELFAQHTWPLAGLSSAARGSAVMAVSQS
jgi:hypothetical protein